MSNVMVENKEVVGDEYEGCSREQFMDALMSASRPMAERAERAKAKGMIGEEDSCRFLDEILDAGS